MTRRSAHAHRLAELPLWLRLTALVCVLFFAVGAVAQAVHNHDTTTINSSNGKQTHNAQTDCQLCVAMHSAAITPTQIAPEAVAFTRCFEVVTSEVARSFLWRSVLASRPPPFQTPASSSQVFVAA